MFSRHLTLYLDEEGGGFAGLLETNHLDPMDTSTLLSELRSCRERIAEIERALVEEREVAAKLFGQFQQFQSSLAEHLGMPSSPAARRHPTGNINVSMGKVVARCHRDGLSSQEAQRNAIARALKVAKGYGLTALPDLSLEYLEDLIDKYYGQEPVQEARTATSVDEFDLGE
jgi:hypothetical protein